MSKRTGTHLGAGATPDKAYKLSRRDFIRLASIAAGGAVLAACAPQATAVPATATTAAPAPTTAATTAAGPTTASPTSAPPTAANLTGTLETWTPDTRDDAIASEKWWAGEFGKKYPNVKINQLIVPYGDDTTKITAGDKAGVVPDMMYAYSEFLYTYGADGIAAPVDDVIDAIGRSRFIPSVLQGITLDGKLYTVPETGFPFFIYYRKDLYAKLGLKPPTSHDELLANIKAVHNPPDLYGYMVTNQAVSDVWNLKSAMWTHGAYYFDKDGKLALDRPETIDAWTFYKQLASYTPPGSMAQSDLQSRQLYTDGKVAHMLTTTSESANFTPGTISRYGGFLYPQKAGAKGASMDCQGNIIPVKAKSPQNAKAAIEFLFDPDNFQEYLARTVVGWVPMLADAYTDKYLNNPRIGLVREFIELGLESAKSGVFGAGYFGPNKNESVLVSTDIEKQIGDRLVLQNQDPKQVLDFAVKTIQAAM